MSGEGSGRALPPRTAPAVALAPAGEPAPARPSISACFPAYNDGGTISSVVIAAILTLRELSDEFEVIVCNDGSTDYTGDVLDELTRRYPELTVIHHAHNRGYGHALRSAFGVPFDGCV